jgi:hypothetical protein
MSLVESDGKKGRYRQLANTVSEKNTERKRERRKVPVLKFHHPRRFLEETRNPYKI